MNCRKQAFTACCPRDLQKQKTHGASKTLIVQMFLTGTHVAKKNRKFGSAKQEKYEKTWFFQFLNLQNLHVTYKFMQVKARTSSATKI